MEKKRIYVALVATNKEYGIIKCKERWCTNYGEFIGKVETWYDVCLDKGEGDIVASFKSIREAKRYITEN